MARNYKKNPHTARWLMTFHTAAAGLPAEIEEERAALEFTAAAQPAAERKTAYSGTASQTEIFIQGWRVKIGPGLVTEKQAKWIVSIAETKANVTENMIKSLAARLEQGFARSAASEFITRYKDWPVKEYAPTASQAKAGHDVPQAEVATDKRDAAGVAEGRYAVEEDGVLKFLRVTEGKARWAGRTFVEIQASDDRYAVRNPARRNALLAAIAADPEAAATRYGVELGHCYRCGRTLTDETSRALGIGPDCRSK